jgi:hypothetical protein
MLTLRPYQLNIAEAVLDSVFYRKGLTFSVEIARQGGKNELSAHLERLLLVLNLKESLQLIKCSPTFKPQSVISLMRLKERLNDIGLNGVWSLEMGYIVRLGLARALFLSADTGSNVVGNTAHLLLEVDESQDVNKDKYNKEFKPMAAAANCTVVHYGTTWDDSTLLEEIKQTNLELEKKDGIRRHFRFDYQAVGRYNPDYLINVEMEKQRLGENHPLFLTQYRLLPVHGGGGFLNSIQLAQLQGEHSRLSQPPEKIVLRDNSKNHSSPIVNFNSPSSPVFINHSPVYLAGVDLAGEAETEFDELKSNTHPRRDSAVVTIGELDWSVCRDFQTLPCVRVVEHYSWLGEPHPALYTRLIDLLKNVWRCKKVAVDSTGVGEPVAAFLRETLGNRIVPFKFTAQSKSLLGFNLLSAVNSGRLKIYSPDGSPEYREMWSELHQARSFYRPNRTFNFYVDPADGHDDYLMSLALLVEAAGLYAPRTARGKDSPVV